MAENPYAKYATQPASRPRYETIRGRVDPYKVKSENRANEDQSLQREANARADRSLQLSEAANRRADHAMERADAKDAREEARLRRKDAREEARLRRAPPAVMGGYLENKTAIRKLQNAIAGVDKYPQGLGAQNMLGDFVNQRFDPDGVNVRADISDIGSLKIHDRSGAAVTALETPRLLPFIPSASDTPDAARKKLQRLLEEVNSTQMSIGDIYEIPNEGESGGGIQRSPRVAGDYADPKNSIANTGATETSIPVPPDMQSALRDYVIKHRDNLDPQDFAAAFNYLAKENGYEGRIDPNSEQTQSELKALREGANYGGVKPLTKPLSQFDQARNNLGQTDEGAALTTGINAATLGIPTLLAGQEGVDALSTLRERKPIPALAGEVVGGIGGALATGGALSATGRLAGLGEAALARTSGAVATNTVQGGVTGFNNAGEGQGVAQGIVGAALGGGITRGLQGAGAALANRPSAIASRQIQEAADRQGVELMAGDKGGTLQSLMTAGMAQSPVASGTIVKAANRVNNQIGGRLDELANLQGAPVRQEVFGDTVRKAATDFAKRSGASAKREYDAAKAIDEGQTFTADTARKTLNDNLTELGETPSTSADVIKGLRTILRDIPVGKNLSIDAIRRLRTNVRSMAQSDKLSVTDFERRAMGVMDDLSADMAGQMSPAKAAAFLKADRNYAERMEMIKNVIPEIIGPSGQRSSEMVAKRLIGMSRTDSARTTKFIEELEPSEQGIVRGSIIKEMGRATPTNQTPNGDAFSLVEFNKVFNDMPERSKQIIFPNNTRNIANDLAIIANGAKSSRRFANTSNTALALNAGALVGKAVSGGAAVKSLGLTIPAELLTAQLLAHPRIIRSLANLVRINTPERRAAALSALQGMAVRVPGLAVQEISDFIKGQK
jgi:hypothetical protein